MNKTTKRQEGLALSKSKGFTLIEILVVIGIIAILAAVVLIAINPARQFKQARDSQRTSNVNAILNAIGQYIADNKGDLPAAVAAIVDTNEHQISSTDVNLCLNIVPIYMPALPTDPNSDHDGESLDATDCAAAYDTDYIIKKDTNGRITVKAVPEIAASIEVTR